MLLVVTEAVVDHKVVMEEDTTKLALVKPTTIHPVEDTTKVLGEAAITNPLAMDKAAAVVVAMVEVVAAEVEVAMEGVETKVVMVVVEEEEVIRGKISTTL